MKKTVIGLIVLFAALGVFAADISQTASAVEKNLPRIEFYKQVNDAMYQITQVDLPAIIAKLNAVDGVWSNVTGSITVSNMNVLGSISVVDDALQVADIGAGSLPSDVIATAFSNATASVTFSNMTAGGTITVPDSSIDVDKLTGGLTTNITLGAGSDYTNSLVVTNVLRNVTIP